MFLQRQSYSFAFFFPCLNSCLFIIYLSTLFFPLFDSNVYSISVTPHFGVTFGFFIDNQVINNYQTVYNQYNIFFCCLLCCLFLQELFFIFSLRCVFLLSSLPSFSSSVFVPPSFTLHLAYPVFYSFSSFSFLQVFIPTSL